MGGKVRKQWLHLGGIPILIHTLQKFFNSAHVDNIIVTAPEEELGYCEELIHEYFEDSVKPWLVVCGSIERQDSVFCALQTARQKRNSCSSDAVRPFITEDLIEELLKIVRDKAVIPVARLKTPSRA